jgi:ArsR family transcriptional regulator
MSDVVNVFKALSEGTRLRILNILMVRECCVCEVMQVLGISQPSASRHLAILHEAGLLKAKKEGIWMYYAVDWDHMPVYAKDAIGAVKLALSDQPEARDDREKLKSTVRQNIVCKN